MPIPILQTKLYLPQLRPQAVSRPHLLERLNQGLHLGAKLTLIAAPAGFGKSTLLAEWLHTTIHTTNRACAWLVLDEGDDTLPRFLTYLIAALQTVMPDVGAALLPALQSTNTVSIEPLLTELLNELAATPEPLLLVLDDYHVIEEPAIDRALTFLLDHLPPQLHLVIAGRADPALPLSRLRARRELTELRTVDLRFTPEEVATVLHKLTGLTLAPEAVTALEQQTEGWIAGLQLAALSLEGATDSTDLLTALRNSNRHILDYLTDEVIHKRSPAIQEFLLKTSILDRFCAPLCDALLKAEDRRLVTGDLGQPSSSTSQATIEQLERANLFLIPLDGERRWYRYHH
ncbi:MAG: hypothetical protein KDE53_39650, partial [Caldilineaceae bacterium]|nr:hypothetical protein [Caldilineaceae bacterium]